MLLQHPVVGTAAKRPCPATRRGSASRPALLLQRQQQCRSQVPAGLAAAAAAATPAPPTTQPVKPEQEVAGMTAFLDGLKWDKSGLVAVIVQVRVARRIPSGLCSLHGRGVNTAEQARKKCDAGGSCSPAPTPPAVCNYTAR